MLDKKKELYLQYSIKSRENLNDQFMSIALFYLGASLIWTTVFQLLKLPYSRAHIGILLLCLGFGGAIFLINKVVRTSVKSKTHFVLLYFIGLIIGLYFGSGYTEAWSYFLLIPLIAGFYWDAWLLMLYSSIGIIALLITSIYFPFYPKVYDSIDISNRVLLYLIIVTLSYLFMRKLQGLYGEQVSTVSAKRTIEQVVKSFVVAIEAKDQYTFGHSERVSLYAVELARSLKEYQDEQKLNDLRLSALLHDMGKINIPESILIKPGLLTEREFAIIKTHPIVGARMIEKISGLEHLKSGILYHHERWDGQGYPTGKKGDAIPLEARILAVADAFDAMTSSRAYRKGMDYRTAFKALEEGRSTQFDPNLLNALSTVKHKWIKIYQESENNLTDFEILTDLL